MGEPEHPDVVIGMGPGGEYRAIEDALRNLGSS